MTPVEYGVLMHGVMQNLTLCEPMDDASIRQQLSEMVRRNLLQEAQLQELEVESIAAFFAAPLGCKYIQTAHAQKTVGSKIKFAVCADVWKTLVASSIYFGT